MTTWLTWLLVVLMSLAALAGCQRPGVDRRQTLRAEFQARQEAWHRSVDLHRQGMAAYHRGDLQLAAERLEAAVHADSGNAAAWLAMGVAAFDQRRVFEAAQAFEQAAGLAPADFEPHYNLGLLFESLGYHDQAIDAYESALRLAPDHLHVMENLARVYIRAERNLERARLLVSRALEREFRPQWRQWLQLQAVQLDHRLEAATSLTEKRP
jgi:Flp pilus assembly protein TadD